MERLGVVVVAAGKGSRMGTEVSKQYLLLAGKPVLVHTLQIFEQMPEVLDIVTVTGASDVAQVEQFCKDYGLHKVRHVVPGGHDRQASVLEGLKALPATIDWVIIHDGVRPFVTANAALRCVEGARATGAAVLAVPVKDTIKQIDSDGHIIATPERESLRAIQTPQAFRRELIVAAHMQAAGSDLRATDDAALAERMGMTVATVEGEYSNIKLTTPEDLAVAETLLKLRETQAGG